MGSKTKIDWCDASWNPVTGCLHDCQYCYARRIAERFSTEQKYKRPYEPVLPVPTRRVRTKPEPYPYGFKPTFHRYRLDEPQRWKKPRTIFVCSMADLFGEWVPDEWIREVLEACDKASQHRYMFLTKNPGRYAELPNLLPKHRRPPNVAEMWFGQSFTGAVHNYMPLVLPPWQNRFVSIEPLLRNLSRAEAMEIATKCAIYSVRPMVCRLFGVAKGMTCSHGNSAEIDCTGLIDFGQTFCGCQNGMDWNVSERPK